MTARISVLGMWLALSVLPRLAAASITYSDGFESPTLNPFWATVQDSGSISLTTSIAHSGGQALQLNSTNTGLSKNVYVYHAFSEPIYGTVSAWVFDTGADERSSNLIQLGVTRQGVPGNTAGLFTWDYDLTPTNGGSYLYAYAGSPWLHSSVDRTKNWHLFVINVLPNSLNLSIDGSTVYSSNQDIPFDRVFLRMAAPSWRPAWTSYFDDFSLVESSTVPEPAALAVWSMLGFAGGLIVWRRRREERRHACGMTRSR